MNKKYTDTFRKFRITESVENNPTDDEQTEDLDEASDTSAVGAYDTPYAFGELSADAIELLGYKKVKKPNKNESAFKKLSSEMFLSEASYHEYKKDTNLTPKQKVNHSITEINRKLRDIERVINHNVRLKKDAGVDTGQYWKSSQENLIKISERLLRISSQLKELSA